MKPILFNTEMVQAILAGRKTVTRRAMKLRYRDDEGGFQIITTRSGKFVRVEKVDENECGIFPDGSERVVNPPYHPGDILWVRETWEKWAGKYHYRADYNTDRDREWTQANACAKWNPSIHMPREAARLFLRVTGVRVERLQDITEEQAVLEGVFLDSPDFIPTYHYDKSRCNVPGAGWSTARECFLWGVWDSTVKTADRTVYGHFANPWVWAIEFERCVKPESEG